MVFTVLLRNLSLSACNQDIRQFFSGLSIPDGGIHIFGDEDGLAFIKFSTDVNAVLALAKDGGEIKGKKVKLLLSNEKEMARMIQETERKFSGSVQSDLSLLFPSLNLQGLHRPSISGINRNSNCKRPLTRDPRLERNLHLNRHERKSHICYELSNGEESQKEGMPQDFPESKAYETHFINANQFSMPLPVSDKSACVSAVPKSESYQVSANAPLLPTPASCPVYERQPLLTPASRITSHNQFLRFHPYNNTSWKQRAEF